MTEINRDVVAQYYIECELDNIVVGDNMQIKTGLYHSNIQRLLEALSFTYRANGVFDYITSDKYEWEEREISIDDLTLTGMDDYLTRIIYSDAVQRSPRKFAEYIKSHRDDPRLDEISASPVPQNRQILLLREQDDKIKLLDGSHRFMSMVLNGAESFKAYVAVLDNPDAKPMIGDTIFLRLRKLWMNTNDPSFKNSIEETVKGMIRETSNGAESVRKYWLSPELDDQTKAMGVKLLENSAQIPS